MIRVDQNQLAMSLGNNSARSLSQTPSNFSDILQTQMKNQSMEDIFLEASNTYGVPINLLKAVAKAESNFNPDAVSGSGAQGVMQLMPKTAAGLGVTDSFDPKQNIMGGAKYLAQMLKRYDGDAKLSLAAYNAGSGNVKKYGGIPPFKETRNYIDKVMKYAGESINTANLSSENSAYPQIGGVPLAYPQGDSALISQIQQFEGYTAEDYQMFVQSLKMNLATISSTPEVNGSMWDNRVQKLY